MAAIRKTNAQIRRWSSRNIEHCGPLGLTPCQGNKVKFTERMLKNEKEELRREDPRPLHLGSDFLP